MSSDMKEVSMEAFGRSKAINFVVNPTFVRDMKREKWKLMEDVHVPSSFSVTELRLIPLLLEQGEASIRSEKRMIDRIEQKLKMRLGQRHAEALLGRQEDIPKKWQDYFLIFTGTIWKSHYMHHVVPWLFWNDTEWVLRFIPLGCEFGFEVRLVEFDGGE